MLLIVAAPEGIGAQTAPQYTLDRWNVEDGLPNNALSHITQSRDGYLWIATWAGTVRFDGVRFTPIAEDLPNDHARVLFEDRDGAMWIGVSGAGLVRWRDGRFETLTTAEGLAGHDVRALAQDSEGRIWVATENGISAIDPPPFGADRPGRSQWAGRITTYRVEHGLSANSITALATGRDRSLWVATTKTVCVRQPRAAALRARSDPSAGVRTPSWRISADASGSAPTPGSSRTASTRRRSPGIRSTCSSPAREGGLWVGFADGIVARIDDGGIERYGPADGLPRGAGRVALRRSRRQRVGRHLQRRTHPSQAEARDDVLDGGRAADPRRRLDRAGRRRHDLGGHAVRAGVGARRRPLRAALRRAHEGRLRVGAVAGARRLALDRHARQRRVSLERRPHGALRPGQRAVGYARRRLCSRTATASSGSAPSSAACTPSRTAGCRARSARRTAWRPDTSPASRRIATAACGSDRTRTASRCTKAAAFGRSRRPRARRRATSPDCSSTAAAISGSAAPPTGCSAGATDATSRSASRRDSAIG